MTIRMNAPLSFSILVLLVNCTCSLAGSPDEIEAQDSYNETYAAYGSADRRKASEASGSNGQQQIQQQGRQMPQDGDLRVPYWNIAHMINSISQIEKVLR